MLNQQSELFPPEQTSPTIAHSLVEELKAEKQLIAKAAESVGSFLFAQLQFNASTPTIDQTVNFLTNRFDYGVKLYLTDIAEILREKDDIVGDYARNHLTIDALQKALRGKDEKQRTNDENTLDELFARTLQLRSSDKFKEVIEFVARLREYSPFNNMLVKLQRPDARYYATASHWKKEFGRGVKLDAVPIVILRPMGPVMLVYDVDDTTGKPLPPQIENPFSVSGEFDSDLHYQMLLNCKKVGIAVEDADLAKSHAGTAIRQATAGDVKLIIQINKTHDVKVKYSTLCHEPAHLFLGHLGGDPYGQQWNSRIGLTQTQRELEAEATSYILCVRAGLESNSAEYLSAYLANPEDIKKISIEAIMKTVTYIEQMSSKTFRPRRPKDSKNKTSN